MASIFADTVKTLQKQAKKNQSVLVSYSGGKDSLACLDLCSRAFPHIVCVHMYIVPGMQHLEERLQWAREKYNVEILQYPHWVFYKCLKNAIFRNTHRMFDAIPDVTLADIYRMIRLETGIKAVVHGGKDADGLWRRRWFSATSKGQNYKDMIYPIKGWSKYDVLAYLQAQKIPIPAESIGTSGLNSRIAGVDLSAGSICWLHDTYPDDYKRLLRIFPHAEAVIHRRDWYGIGK